MLLQCEAGDDVAVQVGEHEGKVLEQLFHEALESLCHVAKARRHEEVLKLSELMIAIFAMSCDAIGI
jgi:hypothetical protein